MRKIAFAAIFLVLLTVFIPMTASAADTFTLHAAVPDNWAEPGFYGWGGSLNMTWPGEAMTDEGNGWYSFEVSSDAEGLIVNANGGSVQTPDIKGFEAAEMWVVVNSDTTYTLYYEIPELDQPTVQPEETPVISASDTPAESADSGFFADNVWCFLGAAAIISAAAVGGAVLGIKKGRKN